MDLTEAEGIKKRNQEYTEELLKKKHKTLNDPNKMMLSKSCTQYAREFGKLSGGHGTGKGQFHSSRKEGQCQRMLKLLHDCTYFTCY